MSEEQIDAQVGKVMGMRQWMEMPAEEGLPAFALHVYGMAGTSNRTWTTTGEPPCLVTIRGDDKERLRAMANEFGANGIWIDDELWPAHQLHHFSIRTVGEGPLVEADDR
jgi:hypothetical protein